MKNSSLRCLHFGQLVKKEEIFHLNFVTQQGFLFSSLSFVVSSSFDERLVITD